MIKMPKDLYATLSDSTKPPLPQERRTQLLARLEEELQDRVASEFRLLRLPDDFKRLCALTNALEGPGLPGTNYGYMPHAFDGLDAMRESLKKHSADQMIKESCLDYLDYKVAVSIWMEGTSGAISGGHWLCWCKDNSTKTWTWRWAARPGFENPPRNYDNVMELLDKHRKDWLSNIIQKYGDLGQDDL
ncbi:hypothetical protein KCU71_g11243, partial [Aureobasidium melanogenum]